MNRLLFLLLILLLTACTQNLPTPQVRPDQLSFPPLHFTFPEVDKIQLDNGIKLYLKEDHELPLVELTMMIRGGSIHDPADKVGLSRLFAAALESGGAGDLTPSRLEAELEAMAADLSVSSSAFCYEINLSLQQRDLQRGLAIFADLLRRPRFDQERLELARKQLLEGIRRKNDDPESIAGRLLDEAVFPGHPFGATPDIATVERITRADLLDLHRRYFQPENLWIAVSGAIEEQAFISLLQQSLGDWQRSEMIAHPLPLLPEAPSGRILVADKPIPQTTILMGHPGISKDNPDMFPLRVANYILGGGGFNSRMMREIRSNRGLAYSVYSYFQIGRLLPELFVAGSETKTESTVEVISLMRRLIQQLIDEPVTADELELAKQSLINSFVFAFSDTHSIVSRKVRLDFYQYPPHYLENYQQMIAAVTVADVQRVARQYLHPDDLQIVLVGNSREFIDSLGELGLPVEQVQLDAGQPSATKEN